MSPRKVPLLAQREAPVNWRRAFFSGVVAALLMVLFVDICAMLGVTRFSFSVYLGSIAFGEPGGSLNANAWTLGFLLNLVAGGIFGVFYGAFFEFVFRRSGSGLGAVMGLGHAVIVALIVFPFFNILHSFMDTGLYPNFGFFGSGMGLSTVLVLLLGHIGFGAAMGAFYGPVRVARVRSREFEPGENLLPGDRHAITSDEDPEQKTAASY